jgi:phospholipid/cholesterol/gamma-HCH transport system ATP-binding protein
VNESIEETQDIRVRVENVSVQFGANEVLREILLEIPEGQTLVLLGESGCGKTVLLKSMIGLIQPTHGRVVFDNNDWSQLSEQEVSQLRQRFGYVFQNAALFDSLTVGQNIAFPLRQQGNCSPAQIRELVLESLAAVGLPAEVVYKKPAELSGGMRKRVGLARALILNPEIVLYDEPTTGLDPIMSDVINELILQTRSRRRVTSVVVTHDMTTARKVADRIVMLYPLSRLEANEPQIIFDGTPEQLATVRDRRVRQFVNGDAGQRLMEMRAEAGGVA